MAATCSRATPTTPNLPGSVCWSPSAVGAGLRLSHGADARVSQQSCLKPPQRRGVRNRRAGSPKQRCTSRKRLNPGSAPTDGNPIAAMEAKRKAIDCYVAYRRSGGENHYVDGRISLAVTEHLLAGNVAAGRPHLPVICCRSKVPRPAHLLRSPPSHRFWNPRPPLC